MTLISTTQSSTQPASEPASTHFATRWPPRAAALLTGVVLWVVAVLLPLILLGELKRQFVSPGLLFALLWAGPVILVGSILWRIQAGLVVGFPVAVVAAVASESSLTGPRIYGWVPFWVVVIVAVAYFVVVLAGNRPSPARTRFGDAFRGMGRFWLWHAVLHGLLAAIVLICPWWLAFWSSAAAEVFSDLDGQRDRWLQGAFVAGWLLVWTFVVVRYQLPLLFGARTNWMRQRALVIRSDLVRFRDIELQKDRIKMALLWSSVLAVLCILSVVVYSYNR